MTARERAMCQLDYQAWPASRTRRSRVPRAERTHEQAGIGSEVVVADIPAGCLKAIDSVDFLLRAEAPGLLNPCFDEARGPATGLDTALMTHGLTGDGVVGGPRQCRRLTLRRAIRPRADGRVAAARAPQCSQIRRWPRSRWTGWCAVP